MQAAEQQAFEELRAAELSCQGCGQLQESQQHIRTLAPVPPSSHSSFCDEAHESSQLPGGIGSGGAGGGAGDGAHADDDEGDDAAGDDAAGDDAVGDDAAGDDAAGDDAAGDDAAGGDAAERTPQSEQSVPYAQVFPMA